MKMKKLSTLIIAVFLVVQLITGCSTSPQSNYHCISYITSTSLSLEGIETEQQIWEYEDELSSDDPQEMTVEFLGETYSGHPLSLDWIYGSSYPAYLCSGDHAVFSIRKDTGSLVQFSYRNILNETEALLPDLSEPEKAATEMSDKIVANYANPADYQRTVSIKEEAVEIEGNHYTITLYKILYRKMIGGIPSNDLFFITINSKGHLQSFQIGNLGEFDHISQNDISQEELDNSVMQRIQEITEHYESKGYTFTSHEIKSQKLCYTPGYKLAVLTSVSMNFHNGEDDFGFLADITTLLEENK